jgi:prepilin-type processing-associated H-X9-DG protein
MNSSHKLDYALGQLEGPELAAAEAAREADPTLAAELDRLGLALSRLADDGQDDMLPPEGLRFRTVAFVAEAEATRPRRRRFHDLAPSTVPFKWSDVAVAAGIFIAGLLTLVPAVQRTRTQSMLAGCAFNLRQIGTALSQYSGQHHAFPFVSPENPTAQTGSFAVILHDAKLLNDLDALHCPSNSSARRTPLPDYKTLCSWRHTDPEGFKQALSLDFAYHVGNRQPSGRPCAVKGQLISSIPILADQPPNDGVASVMEGNSPNHNGRGQNILFSDGHVRYRRTRWISGHDTDVYLNSEGKVAPGTDLNDSVLAPSIFPFGGH